MAHYLAVTPYGHPEEGKLFSLEGRGSEWIPCPFPVTASSSRCPPVLSNELRLSSILSEEHFCLGQQISFFFSFLGAMILKQGPPMASGNDPPLTTHYVVSLLRGRWSPPPGVHTVPHFTDLAISLHVPCLQDVWYLHAHHTPCSFSSLCLWSCSLLAQPSDTDDGGLFHSFFVCTSLMRASRPWANSPEGFLALTHIAAESPESQCHAPHYLPLQTSRAGWLIAS